MPLLACESLCCRRESWNESQPASIENVSAAFEAGAFTGFCGPDGCGKGLLLNLLGLLESPDSGAILLNGAGMATLGEEEARVVRNETFGYLFQHPCLLPSFSVAENVAMPLFRICGGDARAARTRTLEVLDFCGIAQLETALAGRLDPFSRMLAAFARALVHRPRILIAIAPRDGGELAALGRKAADELGLCVLWAGREQDLSPYSHRLLHLEHGRLAAETPS